MKAQSREDRGIQGTVECKKAGEMDKKYFPDRPNQYTQSQPYERTFWDSSVVLLSLSRQRQRHDTAAL